MNVNYIVKCRICGSLTRIRIPLGYIRNFGTILSIDNHLLISILFSFII